MRALLLVMSSSAAFACPQPTTHVAARRVDTPQLRIGDTAFHLGQQVDRVGFCGAYVLGADRTMTVRAWDATGATRATWSLHSDKIDLIVRLTCVGGVPHAFTLQGVDAALDVATGERDERPRCDKDDDPVAGIAMRARSDDDRHVITVHDNGAIDVSSRDGTRSLGYLGSPVFSIAASAQLIAIGDEHGLLHRWDYAGKALPVIRVVRDQPYGQVASLAFSPEGARLAIGGGDELVRVIAARATSAPIDRARGHSGWIMDLAFSPDGKRLASASFDGSVRTWDASTGAMLDAVGTNRMQLRASFGPNGLIAFDEDGALREQGKVVQLGAKAGIAIGASIIAVDERSWTLLDPTTLAPRGAGAFAQPIALDPTSISIDPAGKRFAYCEGTTVHVDNLAFPVARDCGPTALSDARLATTEGTLFDLATAQPTPFAGHRITALKFSPDGKRLAFGREHLVGIYDLAAKTTRTFAAHDAPIYGLAWSPDGKRLASAGEDLDILVWNAN